MRQGFTLLELLIVISVLGIAAVNLVTSFGRSQDRIEFQQNVNEISSTIGVAKASAVSDSTNPDALRITQIDTADIRVRSFIDGDGDTNFSDAGGSLDTILKDVTLGGIIDIKEVTVFKDESEVSNPTNIKFYFDPSNNSCRFSVEDALGVDPDGNMISLGIGRKPVEGEEDDEILRCLYFHKKSCLPEILTNCPE